MPRSFFCHRRYRPENTASEGSGKTDDFLQRQKKNHAVKNIVIADAVSTCGGKKHDRKICGEENPAFPEGGTVFRDTGFQGYEPENAVCHQPEKNPGEKNCRRKIRFSIR
ncbi:MAG: hypothetical protein BWK80_62990 [Desulfobacteraceae bacterium IS3]|nr:MAG: hypothetical protein BWK80_62990 [Desulfobacteraceae bacterium IS3]